METRKQQFKSAVSDAIVHLQGSEEALAPFGWTGEKAGWIAFGSGKQTWYTSK